ncbi:MAG: hypothetical protein INR70_21395 [Parafilimonas terrae]|nr:hypothetical protein [Parafilimonas terrae]
MSFSTARRPRFGAQWEYRLLLGLTFPLFLAGAVLRRLRGSEGASLLHDAQARAATILPFAFQG